MSKEDSEGLKWQRRYEREKNARIQAEKILEDKSSQLYEANKLLEEKVQLESSKLRDEEEKFSAIFHHSNDGIILHNDDGFIIDANQTISSLTGISLEQLIGSEIRSIFSNSSLPLFELAKEEITANNSTRYECFLATAELEDIPIEISATRFKLGKVYLTQGIVRDISANREAAKNLELATHTAIKANEAKSLFLATMSHEIRTPLNGVIGFTDLLLQGDLTKEQHEYLTLIKKSGDILINIINDILDFSRIESGTIELENVEFSLLETIEDTLDIHAQTAASKKVELLYSIDDKIPDHYYGDPGRIKQVLINLLSNGLKFTDSGAVTVQVTAGADQIVSFIVKDTGIGFDPSIIEQLLQPFQQADASTTRKHGGTGLGLAICKQLVELMHGTMEIHSEIGKGATFTINIPLTRSSNTPSLDHQKSLDLSSKKVLILDDNLINLRFLEARIQKWGCYADVCDTPKEAVTKIAKNPAHYDLILVDMLMPEMNGFEFARALNQLQLEKKPKLILITSSREIKKQDTINEGFSSIIYKPIKESTITKAIQNAIERSDSQSDSTLMHTARIPRMKLNHFALIVEDNQINSKLAKLLVERLGIVAHIAHNGQEAVDALHSNSFYDIIFMDMRMPIMDGLQATRMIRQGKTFHNYRKTPIIAMTANTLPEDKEACKKAGMNGFLTKPIQLEKMRHYLEKYNII